MAWEWLSAGKLTTETLGTYLTRMSKEGWDFHSVVKGEYLFRRAKTYNPYAPKDGEDPQQLEIKEIAPPKQTADRVRSLDQIERMDRAADKIGAASVIHELTRENLGMGPKTIEDAPPNLFEKISLIVQDAIDHVGTYNSAERCWEAREMVQEVLDDIEKGMKETFPLHVINAGDSVKANDSIQVGSDPFDAVFVLLAELQGYASLTASEFNRGHVTDFVQKIREKLIAAVAFGGAQSNAVKPRPLYEDECKFLLDWVDSAISKVEPEDSEEYDREDAFTAMYGALQQIKIRLSSPPLGRRRDPHLEDEAVCLIDAALHNTQTLSTTRALLESIRERITVTSTAAGEQAKAYAFLRTLIDRGCLRGEQEGCWEDVTKGGQSPCLVCDIKKRWDEYKKE